jgi:RNA polymerase sigma-70 factor, ECF subfamily
MSSILFQKDVLGNSNYLRMFALKLTRNSDDASDLLQDTVLRALKNYTKYKEGSNLKAWLTTIMKNSFINDYRRSKKIQTSPNGDVHSHIIESNANSASNGGEQKMIMDEVYRLLSNLEDDLRIPFEMMWQGYKYEEIAEYLNIPLGTVKSRIFQARKILQDKTKRIFNVNNSFELI